MPIEIKELVIRATVDADGQQSTSGQSTSRAHNTTTTALRDSVEELVKMIKEKNER